MSQMKLVRKEGKNPGAILAHLITAGECNTMVGITTWACSLIMCLVHMKNL